MFKQSIYFVIGHFVTAFSMYATTIPGLNRVGDLDHQTLLNGRAVFEAYPTAIINSWADIEGCTAREDKAYIQEYPPAISREELLKLHREISFKDHRFFDVLGLTYQDYPETRRLIQLLVGKIQAPIYYLKYLYGRPRPYSVIPGSFFPIDKPRMPSYPSRGATEGLLIALFLQDIFDDTRTKEALIALGEDIGYRRQLAGVSFPSDVEGGRALARNLKEVLKEDQDVIKALKASKVELAKKLKVSANGDDMFSFSKTGKTLVFKDSGLKEFISQIQLLTEKSITVEVDRDILINEEFPSNEWAAYLDIITWEKGLSISEDENTIIITEPIKSYEK